MQKIGQMQKNKIVVIGSSNTDMVIQSSHLPMPGETVLGGKFTMNPGGKGANQAVAAARLGGEVAFVARVGNDIFGQQAINGFEKEGINTSCVMVDTKTPSGIALIMVDNKGENCISVALGANAMMSIEDITNAQPLITNAAFILIQLEIPIEVVIAVVKMTKIANVKIVLNPAPAQVLPASIYDDLYLLTPNETEATLLTGVMVNDVASAKAAATVLRTRGVEIVIITMGKKGAYVLSEDFDQLVPCPVVEAVDTTAAGDTFNGGLVVALTEGKPLIQAIQFANKAASKSVTKIGAQASIPTRNQII